MIISLSKERGVVSGSRPVKSEQVGDTGLFPNTKIAECRFCVDHLLIFVIMVLFVLYIVSDKLGTHM